MNQSSLRTDVLVIGSGLAGCAAAWAAAKQGAEVVMITRAGQPEESNTLWAQGGIIYKGKNDSPRKLVEDILTAGAGLSSPDAASLLSEEGPRLVKEILIDELGVDFDRSPGNAGEWHLTAEAAHSLPRILHHKDQTGSAIEQVFLRRASAHPKITLCPGTTAIDLLTVSHHSEEALDVYRPLTCVGAYVLDQANGEIAPLMAKETILATGGLGRVYLHTTNPPGAGGDGIAMAHRAGARCINMQYVQFHPTTLYHPSGRFLISESLRGEGAKLVDGRGREFMRRFHPNGSLAPRDVAARAIYQVMLESGEPCAYLDISHQPAEHVRDRFPTIYSHCLELGIDITRQPIPVVPAAHYSCGGIAVDEWGRTNLERLSAVGEVSCTGLHGANRLASTSLLECLVWGTRAGNQAVERIQNRTGYYFPGIVPWRYEHEAVDPALIAQDWLTIQQTMWNYVGLIRSEKRLNRAFEILRELDAEISRFYEKAEVTDSIIGLRNGIQTARLVLIAAKECRESRGCHYRID
ncbi:MAG: L-aspartate oxidase [Terriglobia bacterium]